MNPNTFTVASLRQSFNHTRDIFGLLNSDVVKMQNTGQGRIYVDYCLGSLRGACLLVFNGTLVKTHSFLGRAEAFPLNLQHVVEALLARILPPFLELEMLLVQMYEVEKSIIASAAMMSPNPWTVLEPTDALLQGLIHQAMAKLGAFIPIITSGMQDLERWKVQSGMLGMMVEWKLSKLIPGIAVGVPFTGVPGG